VRLLGFQVQLRAGLGQASDQAREGEPLLVPEDAMKISVLL
jgi:hypothetical protein